MQLATKSLPGRDDRTFRGLTGYCFALNTFSASSDIFSVIIDGAFRSPLCNIVKICCKIMRRLSSGTLP